MRDRERENAHRIKSTLERYAEDAATIASLARILNYNVNQLREDIDSLSRYLAKLEDSADE